ncbi:MAG: hypothetical protein ABIC40_04880 [bacterium]
MNRLALIFTLAVIVAAIPIPVFAQDFGMVPVFATTDLNVVPVTDTLAEGTFEWDVTARYNDDFDRGRRISTRLFGALFDNFEFGMDWGLQQPAGPVNLSLKYKIIDEYDGKFPVSFAIGASGINGLVAASDMEPWLYGVIGLHDVHLIGWWDWYAGYAYKKAGRVGLTDPNAKDNDDLDSLFGGFKFWVSDRLQVNADVATYTLGDQDEFLVSGGLNYDVDNHIGVQGWVEHYSNPEDNIFVLQFVAQADMKDLTAEVSDPE